ncbi:MAG: NADH-quinone oxidoreductase subunit H, partial [Dehalococcoidia bacterium]|nr:NADH-quinone oxidoreductase subunit H [Dehalococcoidia bacterium]
LSLVGVLLLAGSMSLVGVVEAQRLPFFLLQPLGFFVFLTASIAEMNRPPFDLMEAESELVAGYHTEYSGMKFAVMQLAEFLSPVVASGFVTALFLKGWDGPYLTVLGVPVPPSPVWFLFKWAAVLFVIVWVRATVPRLRIDQVLAFAWKFLFPLSLFNIVVTAVQVLVLPEPTLGQLWLLVGVNITVGLGAVLVLANLQGHRRVQPSAPLPSPVALTQEVR